MSWAFKNVNLAFATIFGNFESLPIFFIQYFWLKFGGNVVIGISYDLKKFQPKI